MELFDGHMRYLEAMEEKFTTCKYDLIANADNEFLRADPRSRGGWRYA